MRYRARDARLKLRRALCAFMAGALALAYPASADELAWTNEGTTIRCAGRTIVLRDPQQVNVNVYWFALDPNHASYAATLTALDAAADDLPNGYGTYAVVDGANGYTGLKIVGPTYGLNGLSISASGVCRDIFNYVCSRNPNYAAVSWRTNEWGDRYKVWGKFLRAPQRIPTTGEDARLNDAKGIGSKTIIYIGQDNVGTGDGSSYLNRRRVKDFLGPRANSTVNPDDYDIVVLCGTLSRFANEGPQTGLTAGSGFLINSGTSTARTQVLSHPIDRAYVMGGCQHGGGGWGEDTDWTDAGDGLWYIDFYGNGSNDGTINIYDGLNFAHTNAGGTRRPLTKVASSAACAALADSWYAAADHGGADYDRLYCRLADGSNPRTTTFWPTNAGGVNIAISETSYFDFFGITFISGSFRSTTNDHDWAMYACVFGYSANPVFGCGAATIDEGTGAYTYDQNSNISLVGCECSYTYAFRYDTNNGHDKVPLNITIRDCYIHHTNLKAEDAYGLNLHSVADLHAIATQGCDGHYIINNRFDRCGIQTIVHYLQPANFTTPSAPLDATDYYTLGAPAIARFDAGGGTSTYVGKGKNITIADNLITNPNCTGLYATDEGQGIAFQGDNNQMLGLNGQYANIKILRNRIEGIALGSSIRLTACWPDGDTDYPEIAYNVVRGALIGFSALNTVTTGGATYEPSFYFHHNDVHADAGTPLFVHLPNVANPSHHEMRLDYNTYRNDGGAIWRWASNQDKTTLAAWTADAPSGDTWDPNSTHVALEV